MPFVRPRRIKRKWVVSRFSKLEETDDLVLQKLKGKQVGRFRYRIACKGHAHYALAYSHDLEALRNREWRYCCEVLPTCVPGALRVGTLDRTRWIVAWMTQLYYMHEAEDYMAEVQRVEAGEDIGDDLQLGAGFDSPSDGESSGAGSSLGLATSPPHSHRWGTVARDAIAVLTLNVVVLIARRCPDEAFSILLFIVNALSCLLLALRWRSGAWARVSKHYAAQVAALERGRRLLWRKKSSLDGSAELATVVAEASTRPKLSPRQRIRRGTSIDINGSIRLGTTLPRRANEMDRTCCFDDCDARSFKVRVGPNYAYNKRKEPSLESLYSLRSLDILSSGEKQLKVYRRTTMFGNETPSGIPGVPAIFCVNLVLPDYPTPNPIWGKEVVDGDSFNAIMIFELRDTVKERWQQGDKSPALEVLRHFVATAMTERSQGDRFKFIARIANLEEAGFDPRMTKMVRRYNGKPLLTRPQHCFDRGENHFEVDIDVHLFNFFAKSALETIKHRLGSLVLEAGFLVEGKTDDELPERMLGCVTLVRPAIDSPCIASVPWNKHSYDDSSSLGDGVADEDDFESEDDDESEEEDAVGADLSDTGDAHSDADDTDETCADQVSKSSGKPRKLLATRAVAGAGRVAYKVLKSPTAGFPRHGKKKQHHVSREMPA